MPAFRSAYLICGDDHGRITERRTRLRVMAEQESGAGGVELLEGDDCTPETVANALCAMTFALGRRFVIADGVERWKEADVAVVADAMKSMDTETLTVAFFGREEGRYKVPAPLRKAVEAAGGQIAEETTVKPRDLPRWLVARAAELGVELDTQAARALIAHVGDRQQRLQRELEKLALEHGAGRAARGRRGRAVLGDVSRAQDRGRSPTRWSRATRGLRPARFSSCASRANGCRACSTAWSAACATRSRSRRRSPPASRPRRSGRACGCRRSRPTG